MLQKTYLFASPPEPEKIVKVHVAIHIPYNIAKDRREVFSAINYKLKEFGIKEKVKPYSLIGCSILELYVNESHKKEVIEQMEQNGKVPQILL